MKSLSVLSAMLLALTYSGFAIDHATSEGTYLVTRLNNAQPIITEAMFQALGDFDSGENINGPSMIRIPDWIAAEDRADPTAVYYLYFAHHGGSYIRMAWAADIEGPWNLYDVGTGVAIGDRGVLDLGGSTISIGNGIVIPNNHLASPCAVVDDINQRIIMYFHSGSTVRVNGIDISGQKTFVATSPYGLEFYGGIEPVILGNSYFQVFEYNGNLYAFDNSGDMYMALDIDDPWTTPPGFNFENDLWTLLSNDPTAGLSIRHTGVLIVGDELQVFYSSRGDEPERIKMSTIDLTVGHDNWNATNPGEEIIQAELDWEGGNITPAPSESGAAPENVNQLRDPYIFRDSDGEIYLIHTARGEDSLALVLLQPPSPADFDLDGWVDYYDLEDLASEWLLSGSDLVADIDNSQKVDFIDYSAFAKDWTGPDWQSPAPDPTWVTAPTTMSSDDTITMTVSVASDESGVEYYFNNITDPTHDSGWQASTAYTDTGLDPDTQYTYQVRARDKSHYQNETAWSAAASATTDPAVASETIFETFDSDPSANGWINDQAGNTTFTYNATGYLDAEINRDSANTARFYKALNQSYYETDEFWFEYDAQLVSTTYNYQIAYAGLFNYNVSDNEHDLLAARFAYWEHNSNPLGNRHDLYCYATDGTKVVIPGTPANPGIAYGQNIRVKIHYWYEYESGLGKASLNVYEVNTNGSTGSLIMAAPTETVIGTGKTLTLNIMGLGNRTDGTTSNNSVIKVDNMYFSTEAENTAPISPSF